MKKIMLVALAALFILSGCGEPAPDKGYVQDKSYDDPDTIHHPGYYQPGTPPRTSCSGGYGKTPRSCTTYPGTPGRYVPGWTEHDGPHWKLKLRDCDNKSEDKDCNEGWKEVTESEYESYGINSHYPDAR